MAGGAIDVFSGAGSLSGVNGFTVDHNPLDNLNVLGALADASVDVLAAIAEWLANTFGDIVQLLADGLAGSVDFFNNIGDFVSHLFDLVFNFGGGIDLSSPEALLGSVIHLIEGVTQLDLTHGPGEFLESLVELLGDWINALLAGVGVAVEDVLKIIAQVFSTPLQILQQGIDGVTEWVLDTIFGLVAPDRIPLLPIGHLMFDRVNLLTNPQFTDEAIASAFQGDWVLDAEVTHSDPSLGSRSARIDANGKEHTLISTDLIPVHGLSLTNAQQLHVAAWVKTEDLVGPVGSVRIGLAKYQKADGSDSPTYEDLAIPTQFNDTDWREWKEDWLVEPGVVAVRFHVTVSDEALSGKIWFDDLFLGKNGLLNANWVDGLGELFENFAQLAADFAAQVWATIEDVIKWIKDTTGIDLGAAGDFFNSFVLGLRDSPSQISHLDVTMPGFLNIGAGVTNAITNIENTWEQWIIALTGAGSGAQDTGAASGAELTAAQIEQLIATTMANNTMLANIQASLTAGMSGGDDFEIGTTATPITTDVLWANRGWKEERFNINTGVALTAAAAAAVGRFQVNDRHQANWVGGGINQGARYFRDTTATDAKTLTDYQRITRVTGSKAAQIFLGGEGTDLLYGRVNAAGNEYVVAGFNRDGVYLKYRKAGYNGGNGVGAETGIVASAPCPAPTVGCSYTLECGTDEGVDIYRVLRNGAVVLRWDGRSAGVTHDESHRYWGWGGITGSALLGSAALIPSSVNSVTVTDNFPSPYVGTYLRAYRSLTTPLDKPIDDSPLADNTFDASTSSQDLIFDKVSQEIIVLKAGPLNVTARLEFDEDIQGTERWDLLLYKRAKGDSTRTLFARGSQTAGTGGLTTNPVARAISGSFSVYCNAGDVLELGSGNATVGLLPANKKGVIGDLAGTKSWLTITRGG